VLGRLQALVRERPGATAAEMARLLFGAAGTPARLQLALTLLQARGLIRRSGAGGRGDPFVYYPGERMSDGAAEALERISGPAAPSPVA
jgi:hypothetical protein